jgi:hypothetical protein
VWQQSVFIHSFLHRETIKKGGLRPLHESWPARRVKRGKHGVSVNHVLKHIRAEKKNKAARTPSIKGSLLLPFIVIVTLALTGKGPLATVELLH